MTDPPTLQQALDAGIRRAFTTEQERTTSAGIVVRWALVAEVAGVDGEQWLHTIHSPGEAVWHILGMVEAHAVDLRQALTRHSRGPEHH